MYLFTSFLKGVACLIPVIGVSATTALVLPKTSAEEINKSINLERLEDYKNNCLLVVTNSGIDTGVLACPVLKGSTQASFYLFKKSSGQGFSASKIKSWTLSSANKFEVQKIDSEPSETIVISQNQGWDKLNNKEVNDVCIVQWNDGDFESRRLMTCNLGDTNLRDTSFRLDLLKVSVPNF